MVPHEITKAAVPLDGRIESSDVHRSRGGTLKHCKWRWLAGWLASELVVVQVLLQAFTRHGSCQSVVMHEGRGRTGGGKGAQVRKSKSAYSSR